MAVKNQDNGSNSDGVPQDGVPQDGVPTGGDQPTGTPAESQASEQSTDQVSGDFTGIDRNTLTPDMQKMFDSMNSDYTKAKQGLATQVATLESRRDFAAIGEVVENNPAINRMVWDAIAKIKAGQTLDEQQPDDRNAGLAGATSVPRDDMSPEEQAGRNMIAEEVAKAVKPLADQLNSMAGPLGQMTTYMSQNQASTEHQLLVAKYPAAASLRPQEIQTTQLKYQTASGGMISMEDAFVLMAVKNPALLTATPDQTPSGGKPPTEGGDGVVGVERGGAGGGTGLPKSFMPGSGGFAAIKEAANKLMTDGTGSISGAINRAKGKINSRPNAS